LETQCNSLIMLSFGMPIIILQGSCASSQQRLTVSFFVKFVIKIKTLSRVHIDIIQRKINSGNSRLKERKKERQCCNGSLYAHVLEAAMRCQAGTTLLTSILSQISRDFMPETCRKQNAARPAKGHLRRPLRDALYHVIYHITKNDYCCLH